MMKLCATGSTALAILLLSSANGTAFAPATVSGIVSDASGAMVAKARVLFTPVGQGKAYAAISADSGAWELRAVTPGEYTIEVRRPGFAPYRQRIAVPEDRPLQLDVQLSVGSIEETITVQGGNTIQGQISGVPAQAGSSPIRIRMGGDVQAAKLLRRTLPAYPSGMKAAGLTGTVVLQAIIGREGDILNLESISQDTQADFVDAAIAAVRDWKYEPTLLNGNPIEVITLINVNFTLAP